MNMREELSLLREAPGLVGQMARMMDVPWMWEQIDALDAADRLSGQLLQMDIRPERPMKSRKWWRRRNKSRWMAFQLMESSRAAFQKEHSNGMWTRPPQRGSGNGRG